MQCYDDGSLFRIGIILNGYHGILQIQPHTLEICKSLKEIYITFRLSWGLHIGPILILASMLDSVLSSPEVKGKGKGLNA